MPRTLIVAALALALTGCGQKAGVHEGTAPAAPAEVAPTAPAAPGIGAPLPATDPQGAVLALCDAETSASAGDAEGLRSGFDRAHAFLHEFAATLQATDAATAGRLLEAKEQVESGLADGTPPTEMASRVATLRGVLEEAATAAGTPVQGCF